MLGRLTSCKIKAHLFFVQPNAEYQNAAAQQLMVDSPPEQRQSINAEVCEVDAEPQESSSAAAAEFLELELSLPSSATWTDGPHDIEGGGGNGTHSDVHQHHRQQQDEEQEHFGADLANQLQTMSISELFMRGRANGMREEKLAKHLASNSALVDMIVAFETSIERRQRRSLHNVYPHRALSQSLWRRILKMMSHLTVILPTL